MRRKWMNIGLCSVALFVFFLTPNDVSADSTSVANSDVYRTIDGDGQIWTGSEWVDVGTLLEEIVVEANRDDATHWDAPFRWTVYDPTYITPPWREADPDDTFEVPTNSPGGEITINVETDEWISTSVLPVTGSVAGSGDSDLILWSIETLSTSPSPTPSFSTDKGPSTTLTFGATSSPNGRTYALKYKITAKNGSHTKTITLEQDEISRVRQEYVDMNRHRYPGDPTPTVPANNDIVAHTSGFYYAGEFVTSTNNISNNRGVMHLETVADDIADEIPGKLSYLGKPWMTSGYRRPTLNASLGGEANSLHQFGYALDFTPPWNNPSMADLLNLEVEIQDLLGLTDYDTLVHNSNHVHVEAQTVAQGGETYLKPAIVSGP